MLLNQLLFVLAARGFAGPSKAEPSPVAKEAFDALCFVIHTAQTAHNKGPPEKNPHLMAYVKHSYHIGDAPSGHLHEELMAWMHLAMGYGDRPEPWAKRTHATVLSHAWALFEIALKSMAMHAALAPGSSGARSRASASGRFQREARAVVLESALLATQDRVAPRKRAFQLNAAVAFFLRDLMTFAPLPFCQKLVRDYLRMIGTASPRPGLEVDGQALQFMRIDALEIISSHEHWVVRRCVPPLMQRSSSWLTVRTDPQPAAAARKT